MTTPDGNSFWASPNKTFNASYDYSAPNTPKAIGSVPNTPKALHSNSFISELQDVTKALEKFTFNSPLNDAKSASTSSVDNDRKSQKSLNNLVEDAGSEAGTRRSTASPQPDVLPDSASLRQAVASNESLYARPKSLASPLSPPPLPDSTADVQSAADFFSGSTSFSSVSNASNKNEMPQVPVIPEAAHAVLVSSSVRTYEPKTNFCHPGENCCWLLWLLLVVCSM